MHPAPTKAEVSAAAQVLSRRGASKGGHARAAALTAKQRSAISRKAARARWATKESRP